MDSWTPKQLNLMKAGGNGKCASYLTAKGVNKNTPIKQKYESPVAQLYKEVLKARVEGRPEPTELPKPKPKSGGFGGAAKAGEDANGMERLSGETDQQYIARQTRLKEEARARMASKFGSGGMGGGGGGGMGSSRMAGIGSDPNYNPNGGFGGGGVDVDSLVSGFGSALSSIGSVAKGAAASASAMVQDEGTQRSIQGIAASGGSIWNSFSTSVTSVASQLSQPEDGLSDFNRQMASQRSATGSKYAGFGSDNGTGGGGMSNAGSMGGGMSASAPIQEAPGAPGEDRNGIERLTGETDEQYVVRQTRLRDEAKARMAAKFGGGGMSSAGPSSSSYAQRPPSAPSSTGYTPKPAAAPVPQVTRSAPNSGGWGGAPKKPVQKLKVESSKDFFANFGT